MELQFQKFLANQKEFIADKPEIFQRMWSEIRERFLDVPQPSERQYVELTATGFHLVDYRVKFSVNVLTSILRGLLEMEVLPYDKILTGFAQHPNAELDVVQNMEMKRTTPQSARKMEVNQPTACAEVSAAPVTRDAICFSDLAKWRSCPALGKTAGRNLAGTRAAHSDSGIAPDGARRSNRLQALSRGVESCAMVALAIAALTAPGFAHSRCRGGR